MSFAKLSLVEIFKAKVSTAFSGRAPLRASGRAVEEKILFKIKEGFGHFKPGEIFFNVLLQNTMGMRITKRGRGVSLKRTCGKINLRRDSEDVLFRGLLCRLSQMVL